MMNCKVGGCSNPVVLELREAGLCLDHFLDDIQDRARTYSRQLDHSGLSEPLQQAATQFIVLTAAKIVTIGIQDPPTEQLARGRLLHVMLLLAELREHLDKTPGGKPSG